MTRITAGIGRDTSHSAVSLRRDTYPLEEIRRDTKGYNLQESISSANGRKWSSETRPFTCPFSPGNRNRAVDYVSSELASYYTVNKRNNGIPDYMMARIWPFCPEK
jgi:hypothetical protein